MKSELYKGNSRVINGNELKKYKQINNLNNIKCIKNNQL